jgi:hypothetical protein
MGTRAPDDHSMRDEPMPVPDWPADEAPPAFPRPGDAPPGDDGAPPGDDGAQRGATHGHAADLHGLALAALCRALRDQPRVPPSDGDARMAVRALCDAAHARGLQIEQVLILLKSVWHALPEARVAIRAHDGNILSAVITLCIHEYYIPRRS